MNRGVGAPISIARLLVASPFCDADWNGRGNAETDQNTIRDIRPGAGDGRSVWLRKPTIGPDDAASHPCRSSI
jgi:hypothetical protein